MAIINYLELIHKIDNLVSQHNMGEAREELRHLDIDSIPGKMRARFSSLARRAGEVKLSLKILHNNIYGANESSSQDIIEYSSTLRKLGLTNQALCLLNRLSDEAGIHLHKAFCFISHWDYKRAKEELLLYLKYEGLSEKEVLVAEVNLATCYLEVEMIEEASNLLRKIKASSQRVSQQLYLNILETHGQLYIKRKEYKKAIQVLSEAHRLAEKESGQTSLFILKWLLVARCLDGALSVDSSEVSEFRKKIREMHHWETLRDFDWQMAKVSNDKFLMDYVFFGTPFDAFRKSIYKDIGGDIWPSHYVWTDGQKDESACLPIDLYNMNGLATPYGLALHRLWMLLSSDLYRPWTVGRIFNSLFPDEIYDPVASPKKVYRLIEKLMKVIKDEKINVTLGSTIHGYRLRLNSGAQFVLHRKMQFSSQEEFLYHLLITFGFKEEFSTKDVVKCIPMSQHQWYRALKKMEELGWLIKSKQGRSLFSLKKAS